MSTLGKSIVRQQLAGKRILITGTTGFLGKVLLEKIIRDVPDVGAITLLIRGSRKHATARERFLHEIACSSVFERLKSVDPVGFERYCEDKIDCVTGEVTLARLGLGVEQYEALAARTDVIINSAASVNFREELDQALSINALSLLNLVAFSRQGDNIPFIQVSTCYVNGFNKGAIPEAVLPPAGKAIEKNDHGQYQIKPVIWDLQKKIEKVRQSVESLPELSQKLVALGIRESRRYGWNDTYTFTKWLGEQLVINELANSTLTIVRPSIIESTIEQPAPGWVEGVKVADALIMAYARKKVSLFPGREDGVLDVIPADLVANSIILATSEALQYPGRTRIYQCCSGATNPIKLKDFRDLVQAECQTNYAKYDRLFDGQPKHGFNIVNKTLFIALMQVSRLPYLAWAGLRKLLGAQGKSPSLENMNVALGLSIIFSFYTAPHYVFDNRRLRELHARNTETDQQLFPVDAKFDWSHYLRDVHLAGLNKYALQERKLYRLKTKNKQQKRAA